MGFGSDPFGSAPLGGFFYAPSSPTLGRAAKCRVLGLDGDYDLATDGTGNFADAVDPLDEEAYFRLRTELASYRGDLTVGFNFARFQTTADASPVAIRDACVRALDPMRARGALSAVSVTAQTSAPGGNGRVTYLVSMTKTGVRST